MNNKVKSKEVKAPKQSIDATGKVVAEETDIKEIKQERKEAIKTAEEQGNDINLSLPQSPTEQGKNEQATNQEKPEVPKDNFKGQLTVNKSATTVNDLMATPQEPDKDRILGQSVERADPNTLENETTGKEYRKPFTPPVEGTSVLGLTRDQMIQKNEEEMQDLKREQAGEAQTALNDGTATSLFHQGQKEELEALEALHRSRLAELDTRYPQPVEQQNVKPEDMTTEARDVVTPFKSADEEAGEQQRVTSEMTDRIQEGTSDAEEQDKQGQNDPTDYSDAQTPELSKGQEGTVNTSVIKINDVLAFNLTSMESLQRRQQDELKEAKLRQEDNRISDEVTILTQEHDKQIEQELTAAQSRIDDARKRGESADLLLNGSIQDITGRPLMKDVVDAVKSGKQGELMRQALIPENVLPLVTTDAVESKEKPVEEAPQLETTFDSVGSVENTTITAHDMTDTGSYSYEVNDETGRGIGSRIVFQKGDPRQERNGFTTVDVLNILEHHLKTYLKIDRKKGNEPNEYTQEALTSVKSARKALLERKKDRQKRGVLYSQEK